MFTKPPYPACMNGCCGRVVGDAVVQIGYMCSIFVHLIIPLNTRLSLFFIPGALYVPLQRYTSVPLAAAVLCSQVAQWSGVGTTLMMERLYLHTALLGVDVLFSTQGTKVCVFFYTRSSCSDSSRQGWPGGDPVPALESSKRQDERDHSSEWPRLRPLKSSDRLNPQPVCLYFEAVAPTLNRKRSRRQVCPGAMEQLRHSAWTLSPRFHTLAEKIRIYLTTGSLSSPSSTLSSEALLKLHIPRPEG
jgi:hypothetical protein